MKGKPASHITTHPAGKRVKVTYQGEVIADTRDALELKEGSYPSVFYVPRKDVKMDRLVRSQHQTFCPFKGHASYFSIGTEKEMKDAVWTYEDPFDDMAAIKGLLAFYPDKVEIAAS